MTSERSKISGDQGPSGIPDHQTDESDAAILSYEIPRVEIQSSNPLIITSRKTADYGSFSPASPSYVTQGKGPPRPYFSGDKGWNDEPLAEPSINSSESLVAASHRNDSQRLWRKIPQWSWVLVVIGAAVILGGIVAIIWAAATDAWGTTKLK